MRQEFGAGVDQAIQANTFQQNINLDNGRLLTKVQRIDLNKRVRDVARETGRHPKQIWTTLHRTIGVKVDNMRMESLPLANVVLNMVSEHAATAARWDIEKQELVDSNGKLLKSLEIARRNLEHVHAFEKPMASRKPVVVMLSMFVFGGALGAAGVAAFFLVPW